jgi:heat-inducible transcriptional repressor
MFVTDLETRRNRILATIIDTYIRTASPVGSASVSKRFRLSGFSPATIRNIMVELEELGYLTQPHTSAGRIPTQKAYRYYVDSLMKDEYLIPEEKELIQREYVSESEELESIFEKTSQLLSTLTHCAGMTLFPKVTRDAFKHLELICVGPNRALVVLVTSSSLVKSAMVELHQKKSQEELQRLSRFLNQKLEGLALGEIRDYLFRKSLEEDEPSFLLLKEGIEIINASQVLEGMDRLCLEGTSFIIEQPEFKDSMRRNAILKALEEKRDLLKIMNGDLGEEGVRVHIGSENRFESMRDCSLVVSNYRAKGKSLGTLGVLGPIRMVYPRVVSVVRFAADKLGQILTRLS